MREQQRFYFVENNTVLWRMLSLLDNYATADLSKPGLSKGFPMPQSLGKKMGLYSPVKHTDESEDKPPVDDVLFMAENAMIKAVNEAKLNQTN